MQSRNLVILNIDDQRTHVFTGGKGNARHFDVVQIESWRQTQEVLFAEEELRPDMLLIDVSFDKDNGISGGVQSAPGSIEGIVPVGPLLALPFLNARTVIEYVPYSAHIDNPHLKQHPFFLLAMGLIVAKSEAGPVQSQYLQLDAADTSLDRHISKRTGATNPAMALRQALVGYRDHLERAIDEKRIAFLNPAQLEHDLQRLQRQLDPDSELKRRELGDEFAIELSDRRSSDKIRLASLFADWLDWQDTTVDAAWIDKVLAWIHDREASPYSRALAVIRAQDVEQEHDSPRPRVDQLIKEHFGNLVEDDRHEIFRLCVLFANAHAWALEQGTKQTRQRVYERLGAKVDQNIYHSWFAARGKRRAAKVCPETICVAPLTPFAMPAARGGKQCFFMESGVQIARDDDRLIEQYRRDMEDSVCFAEWTKPYQIV